jgi:Flp pilus assembly protein TadD
MFMAKRAAADIQFEISFYEKVLERSPGFIEALICLGDLYTKQGFFEKGLRVDERLAQLRPQDPVVFYNLACSYSLMADVNSAERAMRHAVELGYGDFEYLSKDPDLINLLNSDTFRIFFKELRARSRQVSRQEETA